MAHVRLGFFRVPGSSVPWTPASPCTASSSTHAARPLRPVARPTAPSAQAARVSASTHAPSAASGDCRSIGPSHSSRSRSSCHGFFLHIERSCANSLRDPNISSRFIVPASLRGALETPGDLGRRSNRRREACCSTSSRTSFAGPCKLPRHRGFVLLQQPAGFGERELLSVVQTRDAADRVARAW